MENGTPRRRRSLRMPFDLPQFAMNALTVGCFNELYFRRIPGGGRTRMLDLERFFYPLDSIRTGIGYTAAAGSCSSNAYSRTKQRDAAYAPCWS